MSNRDVVRIILVAIAVVATLYFLYLIRSVLGLVFVALFLAVALGPPVEFFVRRRFPRGLAILATYVVMLSAIFGVGMLVVPPIVDGVNDFAENVPTYVDDLRESKTFAEYDDKYDITPKLKKQADQLPSRLTDAASGLRSVTVGIFGAVFQLVTILVLTFFLLLDGKRILRFGVREGASQRPERVERFDRIAEKIYRAVGGYVAGSLSIAAIAGISGYIVMTILGLPFAVPLAVLLSFLGLIPLVGSTIGGALVAIVAAIVGFPEKLIIWVIYLVIYQQVENNVLQPLIYKRTLSIHPLIVLIAVLIGATLLGVLGALLAIPIAATVQILVKEWWEWRQEQRSPPPAASAPDEPGLGPGPATAEGAA